MQILNLIPRNHLDTKPFLFSIKKPDFTFLNVKLGVNILKTLIFNGISREDGIRTHDTVTHIQTFQACSFNHSDTSLIVVQRTIKISNNQSERLIHFTA